MINNINKSISKVESLKKMQGHNQSPNFKIPTHLYSQAQSIPHHAPQPDPHNTSFSLSPSDTSSDEQLVKSTARVYADECLKRGPSYYTHNTREEYDKIGWNDASIYGCVRKIGQGKYSEVFEGVNYNKLGDGQDGTAKCVVKILLPSVVSKKKVTRQVKILQYLNHPNIITLLDTVRIPSNVKPNPNKPVNPNKRPHTQTHILVFQSIPTVNKTSHVLFSCSPAALKLYLYQLLQALDHAHSRGIMHRDVKPGNMLIDQQGRVVLIDWGLSGFYIPGKDLSIHVASRGYEAPELLVGYGYYDYGVDLWAFGVVMAQAIFKIPKLIDTPTKHQNLQVINQLLGTESLIAYLKKYSIVMLPEQQQSLTMQKGMNLRGLINEGNKGWASQEAVSLVERLLIFDHNLRPSAKECMQYKYFDQVRGKF